MGEATQTDGTARFLAVRHGADFIRRHGRDAAGLAPTRPR